MTATEYRGYFIDLDRYGSYFYFPIGGYDAEYDGDRWTSNGGYSSSIDDAKDSIDFKLDGKSPWEIKLPDGVIQAYEFISDAILDAVRLNATPLFEIEAI
jgi:hypothetical protein